MSEIKEKVSKEIIAAMKAKDKTKLNVLRYIKKLLIENETSKKPKDEQSIVIGHAKKIKESISLYPDGEQQDELKKEYSVISDYLPEQLTEEDVKNLINKFISNQESPNMGSIMREVSPVIKGKFDGKRATELIKELLN